MLRMTATHRVSFAELPLQSSPLESWDSRSRVNMDGEDLLTKLKELKPKLAALYKAREIGLFGSFVRGEQSADSDIDLLVEFDEEADLFDLVGLALFLEEELQRKVDVVPKSALRAEIRDSVLREVVTL
jgi:predicted nucleotidyltransferase